MTGEGERFIGSLELSTDTAPIGRVTRRGGLAALPALPAKIDAAVDAGSILSFVSGVDAQETSDVLFSVQFASRAADKLFSRQTQTRDWYAQFCKVLEATGWALEQFGFASHHQDEGDFVMDKAALAVISAFATGNQLQAITASLSALEKLADDADAITVFDYHAARDGSGNFQLGAVQKANNGALSMALGAFYFEASEKRRKFLFGSWGANKVNFWTAAQKMTLNVEIYAKVREMVKLKLGAQATDFIVDVSL